MWEHWKDGTLHEQQNYRGTISCKVSIYILKYEIVEVEGEFKWHRDAADKALKYHRYFIRKANDQYVKVREKYLRLCSIAYKNDAEGASIESEIHTFADMASKLLVNLSSYYQNDKSIYVWNRTFKTGPTYCLSVPTHYIHIIRS